MSPISEPKIQRINLADIDVGDRMRPVSENGVESLIASINELGVIKDAIHVRKKRRSGGDSLVLMAGAHRLEAAMRLGWETIPARVWADVTDDWARLMEIDDNLAGADLSALELAVFLAARKKVYERLHPESKAGGDRKSPGFQNQSDIMSFSRSVAEKRDLSKRHIERFVQIGAALSPWEIEGLSSLEKPISLKDLMILAKVEEDHIRVDLVDHLKHAKIRNVAAQLALMQGGKAKPEVDPVEAAYRRLMTEWKRSGAVARRRFIADMQSEIYPMIVADYSQEAAE